MTLFNRTSHVYSDSLTVTRFHFCPSTDAALTTGILPHDDELYVRIYVVSTEWGLKTKPGNTDKPPRARRRLIVSDVILVQPLETRSVSSVSAENTTSTSKPYQHATTHICLQLPFTQGLKRSNLRAPSKVICVSLGSCKRSAIILQRPLDCFDDVSETGLNDHWLKLS